MARLHLTIISFLITLFVSTLSAQDTTVIAEPDSLILPQTINRLTDADFELVASELNIEVAVIKAVIEVEAGKSHKGFVEPKKPIINYSKAMFERRLKRAKINVHASDRLKSPAFANLNIRKYGSYGHAQHARLEAAKQISYDIAIESCFWGMFQIGGFNWKRCGTSSPQEFERLMSESEFSQLELFAQFITNNGMLDFLKKKNWRGFAKAYNGANYKRYQVRLAKAYAKHKK